MANSWLKHVKETMKANSGKSFKDVLKLAKKSYKKVSKSQSKSQSRSSGKKARRQTRRKGLRGGASIADSAASFP